MKRFITIQMMTAFILLSMTGCSLQTTVPPISKYALNVHPKITKVEKSRYSDKVIRMGVIESSPLLSGTGIYYQTDKAESYTYTKTRWNESVTKQLESLMMHTLSKSGLFKDVIPFRSLAKNDLIFEMNIYELSQVIHDDGSSTMRLAVKLRVVEQYSRKIVATKLFEREVKDDQGNVAAALRGYDKMVSALMRETVTWLETAPVS